MNRFMRAVVALTLFVGGASAAAIASGTSPASLVQTTTGITTGTTGTTTGTTATTGTTTGTTTTVTTTTTTTTPPAPARKVTICHHTRSKKNPHHTITVSQNALRAHVRHGDTVGACTSARAVRMHSHAAHTKRFHKGKTLRAENKAERKKRR